MERRKALAIAGSVALTVAAAGAAIAVNVGLLDSGNAGSDVGKLDTRQVVQLSNVSATQPATTSTSKPQVKVVIVDETVPAATAPGTAPSGGGASGDDRDRGGEPSPAPAPAPSPTTPPTAPPATAGPAPTTPPTTAQVDVADDHADDDSADDAGSDQDKAEPQDDKTGSDSQDDD